MPEKTKETISRSEALAATGMALEHALVMQFEFAHRLMRALIASGALTPQAAEDVLLSTARAVEKRVPMAAGAKSPYYSLVRERVHEQTKALQSIAAKLVKAPAAKKGP